MLVLCGCATSVVSQAPSSARAIPTLQGSYYAVTAGETLWRIARSYGIDAAALASVNRLPSTSQLRAGQRLFIPLPRETTQFVWPVRGATYPSHTAGSVEIRTQTGSLVRASRGGRIAVATHQLAGWGKTIVMDHLDGYLTLYAGLDQILVSPGATVRQGTPLGSLGVRALHFEIRYGAISKSAVALLPPE